MTIKMFSLDLDFCLKQAYNKRKGVIKGDSLTMKKVMFLLKVWKLIIKKKHFEIVNHYTGEIIYYTPGWPLIGFTRYLLFIMEREISDLEDLTYEY